MAGNDNPFSSSGISFDVPAPLLIIDEGRKYEVKFEFIRCQQISRMESLNLRNT